MWLHTGANEGGLNTTLQLFTSIKYENYLFCSLEIKEMFTDGIFFSITAFFHEFEKPANNFIYFNFASYSLHWKIWLAVRCVTSGR